MNKQLLLKIKKLILKEPNRLNMHTVINRLSAASEADHKCGTVGCIAGWAMLMEGAKKQHTTYNNLAGGKLGELVSYNWTYSRTHAMKILRITDEQAEALFLTKNWPDPFKSRYECTWYDQKEKRAKITAERIDQFIKHGE